MVIGKKGEDIEKLQRELTNIMGVPAQVSINEIDRPDLDARLAGRSSAGAGFMTCFMPPKISPRKIQTLTPIVP
nr:KH domain-containing protein [Acinetobacter baumannii]